VEGRIFVLEKQSDESLVLVDTIGIGALFASNHMGRLTGGTGGSIDNLMVAPDGTLYAAGERVHIEDVFHRLRRSLSTPQSASFYWCNGSEPSRKY